LTKCHPPKGCDILPPIKEVGASKEDWYFKFLPDNLSRATLIPYRSFTTPLSFANAISLGIHALDSYYLEYFTWQRGFFLPQPLYSVLKIKKVSLDHMGI